MSDGALPPLVGMVHLMALPGAPGFGGSMQAVVDDAVRRARTLASAGFTAVMVENFGDAPFFADRVPPETVAAQAVAAAAVSAVGEIRHGVNVLRNDALAALGVATASGAAFIRVNVLTGSMHTDQGPIIGKAAEVARARTALAPAVDIWADVFVKHASPPPGATLEQSAADTLERGGADALVVSGPSTGAAPPLDRLQRLREVFPDATLAVGSGADPDNLEELAEIADHIIVGTSLEKGGRPGAALDPARLERFVGAAERAGLM